MKLSFSTLGCPGKSYDEVLAMAKDYGYQGVEIRGISGEMSPLNIQDFGLGFQQDAKRKAAAAGIRLIGFGSSAVFDDPDNFDNALADAKACIDTAAALGMGFIRVFGDRIRPEDNEDEVIARVASGIKQACEYAEGTDVLVLQECHGNFNYARRLLKVAELVDNPKFGIIWDVCHSDKTYGDDFPVFYDAMKPLIKHVHFKDHHRLADGGIALCSTGEGDIPLKRILDTLEKDNYEGYISLEWEKAWHKDLAEPEVEFPHFVQYMNSIL